MSATPPPQIMVRPCFQADIPTVRLIYAHAVDTGFGTFDTETPSTAAMAKKWSAIVDAGWPFLVACLTTDVSRVIGFAYAQQFRDRAAYQWTFEDSIYVAPGWTGKGVGDALLGSLLFGLEADGARQVVAVIGDSQNAASIRLHQKHGFVHTGLLKDVGFKFGRWVDVVLMQRTLDPDDEAGEGQAA